MKKLAKGALMGKGQLGVAFLFILCVSVFATTDTAKAYSESFPLVESASVSRSVYANEGDRIVGNFTVSNIPTWTDSNTGNLQTVQYAFKVSKIEGSEQCPTDIVLYEVDQTEHTSFDVYCEFAGDYRFRFNVGSGNLAEGVGNMGVTLTYDVIKNSSYVPRVASSPISESMLNQDPPPSRIETVPVLLGGLAFFIVIFALGVVFAVTRAKKLRWRALPTVNLERCLDILF